MSQSFPVQTTYRDNVLRISMLIVRKIGCNRETRQTLMVFTGFGFFMCTKFFGHYCLHKLAQIALRGNVRLSITELSLYKNLKRSFSSLLSPPPLQTCWNETIVQNISHDSMNIAWRKELWGWGRWVHSVKLCWKVPFFCVYLSNFC